MINTIIFDLGNVLLDFDPMGYLKKKYSVEESLFLYGAIFDTNEWVGLDRGSLSDEEALNQIIERNPDKELLLRDEMSSFCTMFTPIDSTVEILKQLEKENYNLLFLSNIHLRIFEYAFNRYEFFKYFNGGICSSKVKMLKPDKDIYIALIEKYKIDPSMSLFIDDTIQNIETAKNLGFNTIHLEKPGTLKGTLREFGI
jgi:FMN phosphatase YigB (HAD superfamily)